MIFDRVYNVEPTLHFKKYFFVVGRRNKTVLRSPHVVRLLKSWYDTQLTYVLSYEFLKRSCIDIVKRSRQ